MILSLTLLQTPCGCLLQVVFGSGYLDGLHLLLIELGGVGTEGCLALDHR